MRPADSDARSTALDIRRSFLVRAPAGSGKTELLIQRYMALLASVDSPEAVVAITFTRKAASEMRERVVRALREAEAGSPVEDISDAKRRSRELALKLLAHDRSLKWGLLDQPSRMNIQTIDSLCRRITAAMPWTARFGAVPDISDAADAAYRDAADATLRMAAQSDGQGAAIARLALHADNRAQRWRDLIGGMLARREQWLPLAFAVRKAPSEARAACERSLQHLIESILERARMLLPAETAPRIASAARYLAAHAEPTSDLSACRTLHSLPPASAEHLEAWRAIATMLLVKGKVKLLTKVNVNHGFPPKHPQTIAMTQLLADLNARGGDLPKALDAVRNLPAPRYSDAQWQIIESAFDALIAAAVNLNFAFQTRGEVDFTEVALAADRALESPEGPTDLALALGQRIEHILVDEFQDTSQQQWKLLEKLTTGWSDGDGRTLFFVGDPMQSIYRFRRAEVRLFARAENEGLNGVPLETLQLTANFRSVPVLVDEVNQLFGALAPAPEDVERGIVAFRASVAEVAESPGSLTCHGFEGEPQACIAAEAQRVCDIIASCPEASSIAILVRKRAQLTAIARALRLRKMPYHAVDIDPLTGRPVVQDLLALTFAILHPLDRISWLSILRAPWCGLTLADLTAVARQDQNAPVWDLMCRPNPALSEDGQRRLERVRPVLEQALLRRGRQRLRDVVEDAWRALGGPACLDYAAGMEDAAAYFNLLEGVERGGDIDDFALLRDRVESLRANPDPAAGTRIELMTIHKAKGLEFDVVILPDLNGITKNNSPRLLAFRESRTGPLMAVVNETGQSKDLIFSLLARADNEDDAYETARLLYVALTRARKELHLLAWRKPPGSSSWNPSGRSFFAMFPGGFARRFDFQPPNGPAIDEPHANGVRIRRVSSDWSAPEFPRAVRWHAPEETAASPQDRLPSLEELRRIHIGTVVHAYLQRIAVEGLDRWDEASLARSRPAIMSALAHLGMAEDLIPRAAAEVELALSRCIRDPRGQWILRARDQARAELELTGIDGAGQPVSIKIDRTFVDEYGTRWIIDYKTGFHQGSDLEEFLDREQERYREQLERYARLLAPATPGPIRLGLYFPLVSGWREWEAASAAGA